MNSIFNHSNKQNKLNYNGNISFHQDKDKLSPKNRRIILYYQTLIDLKPLISLIEKHMENDTSPLLTHITLASIHFGYNDDKTPYIHLNNNPPDDNKFRDVFVNLKKLSELNVSVSILIGGAGGAFQELFSNYNSFYSLLKEFIDKSGFIDGFNIDVEEDVELDNIVKLVKNLKEDYPSKNIVFAPIAVSLCHDGPGMGGFSYKQLDKEVGDIIDYYNSQCYGEYSLDLYRSMVTNGYSESKIVMGMLSGHDFNSIINQIQIIMNNYGDKFGGVAMWEYFNAPPSSPKNPYIWCEIINKLLYS